MNSVALLFMNELIFQNKIEECYNEFVTLKTDEERVKFIMNLLHEVKISPEQKVITKDSKVSVELRNQANKLYTSTKESHQLDKIIEWYTKSVAYAPNDSQELPIAFANRSAASFKGRLYDESLKDIKRALDLNYPENLRAKLFARKAQCLVVLSAPAVEVEEALQKARKWLEKMDENSQGRKLVEEILNNSINKRAFPEQRVLLDDERNLPAILDQHPEVRGLSSVVEIKYSKEFGRHVVATRDIDPGEVIAIQKSYASVLSREKLFTNCSNCLKQTWSGIPCNFCVDVIYCSEKCREEAWKDHHDLECQILGSIEDTLFLSLRLVIQALKEAGSIENLRKELKKLDSQDSETEKNTEEIVGNDNYASVYILERHSNKRITFNLFYMSIVTALIMPILAIKNNNIFGEQLVNNFKLLAQNSSVTFIGGLFLRYLKIEGTNNYTITARTENIEHMINKGSTLTSSFSYFNHSCNPTCRTSYFGKTMIIYSNSFIKKGNQIFTTYGPDFIILNKFDRQYYLISGYFFMCKCKACEKNWPMFDELPLLKDLNLPIEIKDQAFNKLNCIRLKHFEVLNYKNSDKKEIIKRLSETIKYFSENIPMLFKEFSEVKQDLGLVYELQGNLHQTLD